MIKQFSVFLENSPGRLANLVDVLEKHGIKVLAMGIAEAGNYGIVRMIVDNDEKAFDAMRKENMSVNQAEVLIIELERLAAAVKALSAIGVNIDYAYTMDCGRAVIKVNNEDKAVKALSEAGLKIYPTKC